jgi:hypothetical protein
MRPYFSAGTLDRMRQTDERAMSDTAQVQGSTWIDDGAGGGTPGWGTTATVPCRIAALTQGDAEIVIADVQETVTLYRVNLPLGTAVDVDNRILVGPRTFSILTIPAGTYGTSVILICKEVI